jgi:hypothetical protein
LGIGLAGGVGFIGGRRGLVGELDGEVVLGWGYGAGQLEVGLVFGGEGREGVDLDGFSVDDGEGEAVGGQGEVLAGAFDRRAVGAEELLAGAGLVDDDGLGADLVCADGLVGDG